MQCTASGVRTTSGRVAREERGDDCIAWLVAPVYYAAAQARLAFRLAWSHTSRLEQSFRAAQENILTDKGRKPSSFAMRVVHPLSPLPPLQVVLPAEVNEAASTVAASGNMDGDNRAT